MKKFLAVLFLPVWLSACVPAAIATYAVTRNNTQNQYREYVTGMEKTNAARRDQCLEPIHIKTFDEWKCNS